MNRCVQLVMFLVISVLVGARVEAQVAVRGERPPVMDRSSAASFGMLVPRADSARGAANDAVADDVRAMIGTAASNSQSRHRAEMTGIVIGAAVGAVAGNKLAHDHRPGYSVTPGGGYSLNHPDHSAAYRWSAIGIGAAIGALVGGLVDR